MVDGIARGAGYRLCSNGAAIALVAGGHATCLAGGRRGLGRFTGNHPAADFPSTPAKAFAATAHRRASSAATIAITIIFCAWYFDGSMNWYKVGFEYGTRHFQVMNMGPSMNLARVLNESYGWNLHDPAGVLMLGRDRNLRPPPFTADQLAQDYTWWPLGIRSLADLLIHREFGVLALATAIHDRRQDARILIAIAAPWVLFFALLAQMHERYLVWACGITAIAAGVSFGMTLLHLLVTMLSMLMILPGLLGAHLDNTLAKGWPKDWPEMLTNHLPLPHKAMEYIDAVHLGLGWMTLMVAAVFLVYSCTPGPGNWRYRIFARSPGIARSLP